MCQWIADNSVDRSFRTRSAVKEHLRQMRNSGTDFYRYPLADSIISFAKFHHHRFLHSALQVIYMQQCRNHRRCPANPTHKDLEFIVFAESDAADSIRDWKQNIYEGDVNYFWRSMRMYEEYCTSMLHSALLKQMAVPLARAAITYGQYRDAYVIAQRYSDSYNKVQSNRFYNLSEELDFIRSMLVQALALSYIVFVSPVNASAPSFAAASKQAKLIADAGLITQAELDQIATEIVTAKLRVYSRALWCNTLDAPDPQLVHNRALALANHFKRRSAVSPWNHLILDTIARSLIVSATNLDELNSGFGWMSEADAADRVASESSGRPSAIRRYRKLTTTFLYESFRVKFVGHSVESELNLRNCLLSIVRVFGLDGMQHTKLMLHLLQESAARNMPGALENWKPLDQFVESNEIQTLIDETNGALARHVAMGEVTLFHSEQDDVLRSILAPHLRH